MHTLLVSIIVKCEQGVRYPVPGPSVSSTELPVCGPGVKLEAGTAYLCNQCLGSDIDSLIIFHT